MVGHEYKGSGNTVQGSFRYASHENLSITDGAHSTSSLAPSNRVLLLSILVGAHVRVGSGDASVSDMALPPGIWPLVIKKNETVSVIGLSGGSNGQASVIFVEE